MIMLLLVILNVIKMFSTIHMECDISRLAVLPSQLYSQTRLQQSPFRVKNSGLYRQVAFLKRFCLQRPFLLKAKIGLCREVLLVADIGIIILDFK